MEYIELIQDVASKTRYTRRELRKLLRVIAESIKAQIGAGCDVTWRGLGVFRNLAVGQKACRHPISQKHIIIPPTRRVKLVPCTDLKKRVKASYRLFQEGPDPVTKYLKETQMEKYAVVIDPKKVEKEKLAGKGSSVSDPNCNIPLDADKGSEPYEARAKVKTAIATKP